MGKEKRRRQHEPVSYQLEAACEACGHKWDTTLEFPMRDGLPCPKCGVEMNERQRRELENIVRRGKQL